MQLPEGWAHKSNEVEEGGNFLVAYEGRIFNIRWNSATHYRVRKKSRTKRD